MTPSPRSRLVGVAALLLSLVAFGCASLPGASSGSGTAHPEGEECLHMILERGTLRVGVTGSQPPLNMKNRNGELVGLDVELAQALADAMKVELELVETPFSDLLTSLERGRVDMVISSLTITPARNARVAFAGPYLISGSSLLTRAELADEFQTAEALNSPERTWAALAGSTGEELIASAFPLARFVEIDDQQQAIQQVASGEIDGLLADLPFVRFTIARYPELELATLPSPFTTEPLGVALPANSPLFANLVQNYLNTLDYTGQLMQMKTRWLNSGDWLAEMP
jgi:ABC-type amino acid transport substrate-binding protein